MAKNENSPRRLKGYYPFSKKYPSRRGNQSVSTSRRSKIRERNKKILIGVLLCCVFISAFILVKFCYNLATRPLTDNNDAPSQIITNADIGTVRAIHIDNSVLGEISDLSDVLENAKKNGFNAVVLDLKTPDGTLNYKSSLLKNVDNKDLNDVDNIIIEKIKSEGFIIIARVFCFEDSTAPQRINAYIYEDVEKTKIWFDSPAVFDGKVWLDPTNERAQTYLCNVIDEIIDLGADCIYLQSVQFPQARENSAPVYTEDDTLLNRNLVLLQFIEKAVSTAGNHPIILGIPYEAADSGDMERWGGNLFDTAASICSPEINVTPDSDYIEFISNTYIVMNDKVKNNFSTIKVIPTVKNQPENPDFYKNLSESKAESYIIMP